MGLESANYIADLVNTNPLSADQKNQGDDHIRMLKSVLQNTFPGLGGRFHRVVSKSAGYTVVGTDFSVAFNCTSALTLSLTAAATIGNGFCFAVYASGGDVLIDPNGTELINGASTYTLPQGCLGMVFCDGTGFVIMSNYIPLTQLARTGTAGQVLTSNGTANAPTMQNLPVFRPAGEIASFAMASTPSGWLPCDGAAVSRATYSGLFSAIGISYGAGDGSTTFNVPDFRGHFLRASGTHSDGTASAAMFTKQADAFLNHNHTATTDTQGTHAHTSTGGTYGGNWVQGGTGQSPATSASTATSSDGAHAHNVTVNTSTAGGTETRPDNYAVWVCIKT